MVLYRFTRSRVGVKKGFTIAELMISMTIFSLISMMLVMMFNQSARFEKRMKAELSLKQRVRVVHESLEPYVNSAVPPNSVVPIVFTPFEVERGPFRGEYNTLQSILDAQANPRIDPGPPEARWDIGTFRTQMDQTQRANLDEGESNTLYLWITRTYALKNFYNSQVNFDWRDPRFTGMRITFERQEDDDQFPQGSVSVSALNIRDLDDREENGLGLDVTNDDSWDQGITLFGGRSIGLEDVQFIYEGGDEVRSVVSVVEDARGMVGSTDVARDDDDDPDDPDDPDDGEDDDNITVKRLTLPRVYRLPFQDRPMN